MNKICFIYNYSYQRQKSSELFQHTRHLTNICFGSRLGKGKEIHKNCNFDSLPRDILSIILNFACSKPEDIRNYRLVNKQWQMATNHPQLWKQIAKLFPNIDLDPPSDIEPQIKNIYLKMDEWGCPQEIINLFGGRLKFAQIPIINLPVNFDLLKNNMDQFEENDLENHQIVKMIDQQGRLMIGIRYVRHVDMQDITYVERRFLVSGSYTETLILFPEEEENSFQWKLFDTFEKSKDPSCNGVILGKGYTDWLKKLISGAPCGHLKKTGCWDEPVESAVFNDDGNPKIQLWYPESTSL